MPTPPDRQKPPSALVLKGLDANDLDAIDAALNARRATLPQGAVYSRNAFLVDLIRAAVKPVEGAK